MQFQTPYGERESAKTICGEGVCENLVVLFVGVSKSEGILPRDFWEESPSFQRKVKRLASGPIFQGFTKGSVWLIMKNERVPTENP